MWLNDAPGDLDDAGAVGVVRGCSGGSGGRADRHAAPRPEYHRLVPLSDKSRSGRLRSWLSDAAIRDIRGAGFTFVRLAVDPALVAATPLRAVLINAIGRLQGLGLGVVVSPHPAGWHLETVPEDRSRLRAFWRVMASDLRSLDPALTYPETLNEPVFPGDPIGWQILQRSLLAEIRAALPASTVVMTGQDWGSIGGLLTQAEEADPNVVNSFHFYDPVELTSLAAYRPDLDRLALARLPFPVTDADACRSIAGSVRIHGPTKRCDTIAHWAGIVRGLPRLSPMRPTGLGRITRCCWPANSVPLRC